MEEIRNLPIPFSGKACVSGLRLAEAAGFPPPPFGLRRDHAVARRSERRRAAAQAGRTEESVIHPEHRGILLRELRGAVVLCALVSWW